MTVLDAVEIERHEDPWEAVPVIGGTLVDARAEGAGGGRRAGCHGGILSALRLLRESV